MRQVLILLALAVYASASCEVHPEFWCSSRSVARSCGVETACDQWWESQAEAKPVEISLYFESLCPGCREFITTMLWPTWETFMSTGIMKADMVPYGNAHETPGKGENWQYTCQHGAEECTGNLIENCLQKYTGHMFAVYFPIIHCMESAKDPIQAAERCIRDGKQDWAAISKCANGTEGNALMHQSGLKTEALEPKHTYVPWILVNGQHSEELQQQAQTDLPKLLCATFGGEKPKECSMLSEQSSEEILTRERKIVLI